MSIFTVDNYTPTRVVFGLGRLKELATMELPGKKAMVFVTADGLMEKLGIQQRVLSLLEENGVEAVVYDKITPNPMRKYVMEARDIARQEGCDFFIGLGGGSSIDTAKATSVMMMNDGDLWEYAYAGSGGRKEIKVAAPVMTITTTCGTGTETDPYCVITNEETNEKLDFAVEAIFPKISIIDPELMTSLPHSLTLYQGFDCLFHLAECYITNNHENRLVDIYAEDGIRKVARWLPEVSQDGSNLEARVNMSYAANILAGYTQSLINCTSHHITAQTLGGLFPNVPHGASLILMAEAYYKRVRCYCTELFDELGEFMGVARDPRKPGEGFITGLVDLLEETGMRDLAMSSFGIQKADCAKIADMTVNNTGIDDMDRYPDPLTANDIQEILELSYQ
ncbi:MAG: iron-containing alcohol dehydrogenase [Eubacteriaceae bacterium]|jgi:alcohol dehydrogenase